MTDKKTFDLSSIIGQVSKLDTASAAAVALPIDEVHPNEHNFYDVSSVDSLVDSILLDGLQSPLVVSQRTEDDYVIISGHRRFAALQKICEGGLRIPEGKLFAADINAGRVPCLVNRYGSELEAELALIRANSDTRVLSSVEISRQAERVEMLLYELKGQGYEFPGKMRDYVAQACQVSASKLARLKVIREKLIVPYLKEFEAGHPGAINESVAYELAQLSEDDQHWIYSAGKCLNVSAVASNAAEIKNLKDAQCQDGSPCIQARNRWDCSNGKSGIYQYMPCKYKPMCCKDCSQHSYCRAVCNKCADAIAAKDKKDNDALARADAEKKDEQKKRVGFMYAYSKRVHDLIVAADRETFNAELKKLPPSITCGCYNPWPEDDWADMVADEEFDADSLDVEDLIALAHACNINVQYVLGISDNMQAPSSAPGAWRTDADYTDGMMVAKIVLGEGKLMTSIIYHNKYGFSFAESGKTLKVNVAAWYPVPEYKGDGSDG